MIPIRDAIPSHSTPWVTLALIGVNGAVFIREATLAPEDFERFVFTWGLVPAEFSWLTLLTSMFVHAGWAHAGLNLLSLWIFGDNVEDRLGHGRFLAFYLLTGALAAMAEVIASPASTIPMVGASGAIAGVMGGYLVMFPHSRVHVLVFLIVIIDIVEIPAIFFLGLWFVTQIFGGLGRLAVGGDTGGIAFWAHAAGFLSGMIAVRAFRRKERERPDWWT